MRGNCEVVVNHRLVRLAQSNSLEVIGGGKRPVGGRTNDAEPVIETLPLTCSWPFYLSNY